MMRSSESGSAHIIIIAVLAVALVGAVGTLFWQNVINKPAQTVKTPLFARSPSVSPSPMTKKYCAPVEKLCFDYPSDWTATSKTVDGDTDGMMEQVVVSDQTGAPWLRLETGMGGLGGMCANDDGSYSKILKTHTTSIQGAYLVNEVAKDYVTDTAYALGWIVYSGTNKNWTIDMELNNSKTAQTIGKVDPCDIGMGVLNGKNAKASGSDTAGGVAFTYFTGKDTEQTYPTEAAASAALATAEAVKAYDILQSARYE